MSSENFLKALFSKKQILTVPNLLSLVRLVLGIYIYGFISNGQVSLALTFGVIAIATDYLDGILARALNQISEMGKVLDPLADKVCIALGSIALHLHFGLPLWVVVVIITRDVLIVLGSLVLMTRLKMVKPSEVPGKITVTVMSLLLLSYLLNIQPAQVPLQILTILAIGISFGNYLWKFVKLMNQKEPVMDE